MRAPAKDAARAVAVRLATTKYRYDDSRVAAIAQAIRRYAKRAVAKEREDCLWYVEAAQYSAWPNGTTIEKACKQVAAAIRARVAK